MKTRRSRFRTRAAESAKHGNGLGGRRSRAFLSPARTGPPGLRAVPTCRHPTSHLETWEAVVPCGREPATPPETPPPAHTYFLISLTGVFIRSPPSLTNGAESHDSPSMTGRGTPQGRGRPVLCPPRQGRPSDLRVVVPAFLRTFQHSAFPLSMMPVRPPAPSLNALVSKLVFDVTRGSLGRPHPLVGPP